MSAVTASVVRAELVRALEVDPIGPYKDDEQLDRAPSRFYLTGSSVPREGRGEEPMVEPRDDTESEDAEATTKTAAPRACGPLAASATSDLRRRSVSVLVPPGKTAR